MTSGGSGAAFLADESVERGVVRALRAAGHDVRAIVEDRPGIPDARVLAVARAEQRVLVTNDKDFAELVFRRRAASSGIVLLRLRDWNSDQKAKRLLEVLADRPSPSRALLVVKPRSVRRRAFVDGD